jgi:hypothetical protein
LSRPHTSPPLVPLPLLVAHQQEHQLPN